MKFLYFLRIPPLQLHINWRLKRRKGVTTLISVFLFFIFSTFGLSMLYLSLIYLKLSAYRKNSILLDYASENGIKQGYNHLIHHLSHANSPSLLSQSETHELLENTRKKGSVILEKLFASKPPFQNSQDWENMGWESVTYFDLEKIEEEENYFHAIYKVQICSKGKIKNFKQSRESSLEAFLGILAGKLPLSFISLLIDKKLDPNQKENILENNKISFSSLEKNPLSPQISIAEEDLLPKDAFSQLNKALKINIFRPQELSARLLRAVLGLEKSNDPVPEGVYLIKDNIGLGGIYVEGDLEEMVIAIEEDFQIVSFLTEQGFWILKFSPSKCETLFSSPKEIFHYNLIPLGIIVVNGEIHSLGGGKVNPSGQIVLETEEEIPSILKGINLTIISSDKITLSSHLIHQGVKWTEGIPYVKNSNSHLNIFATGKSFNEDKESDGKIIIDESSPRELKIQASLTASGKGFSIEGKRKSVHILGSLHTSSYFSNKNKLKITFDDRILKESYLAEDAPATAKPVLSLSFFKLTEWKEF